VQREVVRAEPCVQLAVGCADRRFREAARRAGVFDPLIHCLPPAEPVPVVRVVDEKRADARGRSPCAPRAEQSAQTYCIVIDVSADTAMVRIAQDLDGAVLDNFWYAETVDELLTPLRRPIVEVFCRCDPDTAYERFRGRVRHPGHADKERDAVSARTPFFTRAKKLPLRTVGPVVEVDTDRPVVVGSVATRVIEAATLAARASTPNAPPVDSPFGVTSFPSAVSDPSSARAVRGRRRGRGRERSASG
jgi:hypothetical protein